MAGGLSEQQSPDLTRLHAVMAFTDFALGARVLGNQQQRHKQSRHNHGTHTQARRAQAVAGRSCAGQPRPLVGHSRETC